MHVLVTCKYIKDRIKKQPRKSGDIIIHIISQWRLSVAMDTSVLIQSAPKPCAAFPTLQMMLHIKFDQVQKGEIFVIQGQVTPK